MIVVMFSAVLMIYARDSTIAQSIYYILVILWATLFDIYVMNFLASITHKNNRIAECAAKDTPKR